MPERKLLQKGFKMTRAWNKRSTRCGRNEIVSKIIGIILNFGRTRRKKKRKEIYKLVNIYKAALSTTPITERIGRTDSLINRQ